MKKNLYPLIVAIAIFLFALSGCSDNDHKTRSVVPASGGMDEEDVIIRNNSFQGVQIFSSERPRMLHAADFDGDGNLDLIATYGDDGLMVMLGTTNGLFMEPVSYTIAQNPGHMASGDFNSDGKLDLAVCSSTDDSPATGLRPV